MVDRRHFLTMCAAFLGCSEAQTQSLANELRTGPKYRNLALADSALNAYTVTGAKFARILLDDCCMWLPAISASGESMAWFSKAGFLRASRTTQDVLTTDGLAPPRKLVFEGTGRSITISNRGTVVVLGWHRYGGFVITYEAQGRRQELPSVAGTIDLAQVERFSISGNAQRLLIASRDTFLVFDLPSSAIIYSAPGRFPAISPDGTVLVYVDLLHRLIKWDLVENEKTHLFPVWKAFATGAWSPDGRLLLIGAERSRLRPLQALIIEVTGSRFAELWKLDPSEGDWGANLVWINKRFLLQAK